MILIIIFALVALYIYLICPRVINHPDTTPFKNRHYAHRGLHDNRTSAPENSLKAFELAVEAGYGIEMDVQLTKDDIPVIFHDKTLKRMCGKDGYVWDYTFEELQQNTLADSTERIPTFEEVLKLVDGKVPLIIEYKMDRPTVKVCELGNQLLSNYKGVYCIESFHPKAVKWYRKNRPEIVRGQLSMDFSKDEKYNAPYFVVMTYLLSNFITRPDFIAYNYKDEHILSRRICKKLGGLSVAYTIKSQEAYEKVKDKFDLFIFDSFILR